MSDDDVLLSPEDEQELQRQEEEQYPVSEVAPQGLNAAGSAEQGGEQWQEHVPPSPSVSQLPQRLQGRLAFPADEAAAEEADSFDPAQWFMCKPLPGSSDGVYLPRPAHGGLRIREWDPTVGEQFRASFPALQQHYGLLLGAAERCSTHREYEQLAQHSRDLVLYTKSFVAERRGSLQQRLQKLYDSGLTPEVKRQKLCLFHGWCWHHTHRCELYEQLQHSGVSASEIYEYMVVHPACHVRRQQ